MGRFDFRTTDPAILEIVNGYREYGFPSKRAFVEEAIRSFKDSRMETDGTWGREREEFARRIVRITLEELMDAAKKEGHGPEDNQPGNPENSTPEEAEADIGYL